MEKLKTVELTLNGKAITAPEGMTILDAAAENGIKIPTLCYIPKLLPIGSCRICVVEVEKSRTLVASCHTPVAQGMVVFTHSPKVLQTRKTLVELMLASHPDSCLICDKANLCDLRRIAADLDIGFSSIRARKHYYPVESDNPHIVRDLSKCILCRRCVVACKNIKGRNLFSIGYRGFDSKVIYGMDQPVEKDACAACDDCISLCPTAALSKPWSIREPKKGPSAVIKG